MEPIWNIMKIIMVSRMRAIKFHDCLHGSMTKHGAGTATIEAKLAQQLAFLEQETFYGVF